MTTCMARERRYIARQEHSEWTVARVVATSFTEAGWRQCGQAGGRQAGLKRVVRGLLGAKHRQGSKLLNSTLSGANRQHLEAHN